ncbi:MAG: hypothetical protein HY692_06925, partial [Cyanobacteria bacterium NC_groundwater_1444_Ag_S-0.65um_54_12]|nr:hypothetical protein [Cyanobacteria bacterium NC_groundwater_1444_Ag_S-0.65um_54_12]
MKMPQKVHGWRRCPAASRLISLLALSLLAVACAVEMAEESALPSKKPLLLGGNPSLGTSTPGSSSLPKNNPLQQNAPLQQSAPIVSSYGSGLTGTLKVPNPALISNNSSSLLEVSERTIASLPFAVLSLAQQPQTGAEVSLLDVDGNVV